MNCKNCKNKLNDEYYTNCPICDIKLLAIYDNKDLIDYVLANDIVFGEVNCEFDNINDMTLDESIVGYVSYEGMNYPVVKVVGYLNDNFSKDEKEYIDKSIRRKTLVASMDTHFYGSIINHLNKK